MNVAHLRQESIFKSHLVTDETGITYHVKISDGHYSLYDGNKRFTFKGLDYGDFKQHAYIKVTADLGLFDNLDEKEKDCLTQLFKIMKEYWLQYFEQKGKKGIIFIGEYINFDFGTILKKITGYHQLNSKFGLVMENGTKRIYHGNNSKVIAACVSPELQSELNSFLAFVDVLTDIFSENKLLFGKLELRDLFYEGQIFHYCGELLNVQFVENYRRFQIKRHKPDTNELIQEVNILLTKEAFATVLQSIKEQNEFKNLINPPRMHFASFFRKLAYFEKDKIEQQFEKMIDYFGTWEKAEEISSTLLDMVINRRHEEVFHMEKEKISRKQVQIFRLHAEGHYFFVIRCGDYSGKIYKDDTQIIISPDKLPTQIKDFISDYLTEHME